MPLLREDGLKDGSGDVSEDLFEEALPVCTDDQDTAILSHCGITTLKSTFFTNCSNLKYLYLNGNNLQTLDNYRSVADLPNLQHVDLSENNLTDLYFSAFTQNPHLETIKANDNPNLIIIGNDVELPNVKYLYLQNCNISQFPMEELKGLRGLVHLDLRNNSITELPEAILKEFPTLKKILIAGNPITDIPHSLCKLVYQDCLVNNTSSTSDVSTFTREWESTVIGGSRLVVPTHQIPTTALRTNSQTRPMNPAEDLSPLFIVSFMIPIIGIIFFIGFCIMRYRNRDVQISENLEMGNQNSETENQDMESPLMESNRNESLN